MLERAQDTGSVKVAERERLEQSHAALRDQFEAANEVLVALGRSAGDPDTVLTTVVESARRLCQSQAAHLYLLENGVYRLIKAVGLSKESAAYIAEHPMPMDRDTLIGRVGLDRTTQQIPDVLADPAYGRKDLQRVAHFRTTMAAPLVIDDEVVGSMSVWRNEVSPFDEREMAIVTAFAGQAAMALNGVRLMQELEARRAELARKVEELEALREVGEAVKFAEGGGIVEERITGDELQSPSVQLRVLPSGEVELLSTHDQLLGGPSGQKYLGCVFPAAPAYARLITVHAERIGQRLAREGALGRFAVDFVVVRDAAGSWTPYAIELNLRKGGTTHPFLTLQFLTDGRYDPATALFTTPRGHEKHLVATDHLESPTLRSLVPADLFDIVARHGLHFDQSRQEGIVFHMISSLTEHGRLGMTSVGDTPERARRNYREAESILLDEARLALDEYPLRV